MPGPAAARAHILSRYRELLRLIARLPEAAKRAEGLAEARATTRARAAEADPTAALAHAKELAARIGFLRMITPREAPGAGGGTRRYVLRGGELVEGAGESKGERVADGTISVEDAHRWNERHFKRFHGHNKGKNMFF